MEIHWRVLALRNIETLLEKRMFERLYEFSKDKEKEKVYTWIKQGKKDEVVDWMLTHPDLDPGEMSVKGLRLLAQRADVYNYSRLNKLELIRAIKNEEDTNAKIKKEVSK